MASHRERGVCVIFTKNVAYPLSYRERAGVRGKEIN